jgi:hypothetical protein
LYDKQPASPNQRKHGGQPPNPQAGTSSLFSTLDRQKKEKKKKKRTLATAPGKNNDHQFTRNDEIKKVESLTPSRKELNKPVELTSRGRSGSGCPGQLAGGERKKE